MEGLRGADGVDGLLRAMLKEPSDALLGTAPLTKPMPEMAQNADQAQSNEGDVASPDSSKNNDPSCEIREIPRIVESDKDGEDGRDPGVVNIPGEKDQKKAKETKDHHDARELHRKAKAYQALAEELVSSAKAYKDAPPQLSQEFMDEFFPVDPSDGKYTLCVVCGLDGELICCESPGCPTVVHVKCTTMSEAPEGDWFCDECLLKRAENKVHSEHSKKAALTNGPGDSTCSDSLVESNSTRVAAAKSISSQVTGAPESRETSIEADATDPNDVPHDVQLAVAPVKSRDDSNAAAHGLTMLPIVRYDESKHREVSAGLGQLFFIRTGHRRGLKADELSDGRKRKIQGQDEADVESTKDEELVTEKERNIVGHEVTPGTIALGTVFYKKFKGHGTFEGKVTQLPTEEHQFYRVRYEDDDEEDLSESQVLRLLHNRKPKKGPSSAWKKAGDNDDAPAPAKAYDTQPAQVAQQRTVAKKKRGRPKKHSLEDTSRGNLAFNVQPAPETSKVSGAVDAPTKRHQLNLNRKDKAHEDRFKSRANGSVNMERESSYPKFPMVEDEKVENHEASTAGKMNGGRSRKRSLEDTSSGNTTLNVQLVPPETSKVSGAGNAHMKEHSSNMNSNCQAQVDGIDSKANGSVSVDKDVADPKSCFLSEEVGKIENYEQSTPTGKRTRRQPDRFVNRFAT
jgi:hypothetical protein